MSADSTERFPIALRVVGMSLGYGLAVLIAFGLIAFCVHAMLRSRVETYKKLCVGNLRMLEDAIDEVMSVSNFVSSASVTPAMVGEMLKCGSAAAMNWPSGATVNGGPANIEANWEQAIRRSDSNCLSIVYRGETISTGR